MALSSTPLEVKQGAYFNTLLTLIQTSNNQPINLQGYTAKLVAKTTIDPSAPAVITLDSTVMDGGIDLTQSSFGQIRLYILGSVTAAYTWTTLDYDLFITDPDGNPNWILTGTFTFIPSVFIP